VTLDEMLAEGVPPVAAILRGLCPEEAVDVAAALVENGVRILEVPFNSPEPLKSITAIVAAFGDQALIGGGTVLTVGAVEALAGAGGRLLVTPNTSPGVIARGLELGMEVLPGFMTPTEAFQAIAAGARRLKLFPGASLGPAYLKAVCDVLPRHVKVWAVGGTNAGTLKDWLESGAEGIGVGGALFTPGDNAQAVGDRAAALTAAWRSVHA
jgi:2-dehydro-3-deoxyphosphogalactonate aldolase